MSEQPALDVDVDAHGIYTPDLMVANVKADLRMLDLASLHFASDSLNVKAGITAQVVASRNDSLLQADVEVNKLSLVMGNYRYRAESMSCVAASDITYSYVDFLPVILMPH